MIDLKTLQESDKGRWVRYIDEVSGKQETGRIKSWNDKWVFVVYNCADDWDNYEDYTAAATDPKDLIFLGD